MGATSLLIQRYFYLQELPTEPQPVVKAPIIIKNVNDPINEDFLRELALDLGDEWKKVAKY